MAKKEKCVEVLSLACMNVSTLVNKNPSSKNGKTGKVGSVSVMEHPCLISW